MCANFAKNFVVIGSVIGACCRHNDLAYELRANFKNQLGQIDLLQNTSGQFGAAWQTDIPRLRAGHVGGQVRFGSINYTH